MINREGYYVTDTERECTKCRTVFQNKLKTTSICPSCNTKRVKEESPSIRMYRRAKSRAKEKGIEFTLTKDDILIPEVCPILGIRLEVYTGKSGGKPGSPSLDRIDNSKGYTKGNVQVISHLANVMKASATPEQLKTFAKWVDKNY